MFLTLKKTAFQPTAHSDMPTVEVLVESTTFLWSLLFQNMETTLSIHLTTRNKVNNIKVEGKTKKIQVSKGKQWMRNENKERDIWYLPIWTLKAKNESNENKNWVWNVL